MRYIPSLPVFLSFRRPVLQYIRLAKHKLAQADEARRLKERELRPAAQPAAEAKEGEN